MPYYVNYECILCEACMIGCESDAISELDGRAHIDVTICVECGTCERNCVTDAIEYLTDEEYAERIAAEKA